jgi:hypothetical protein
MKKILLTCFILCALSASVSASFEITLSPGFATPGMEKFNAFLSRLVVYRSPLLPDNNRTANVDFALSANLDLLFGMMPGLKMGVRAGYTGCFRGTVQNDNTGANSSVLSTFDTYLIPLMLGMTLSVPVPKTNFTITAAGFGGYGIAGLNETQNNKVFGSFGSGSVSFMSGGFTGDVSMGFSYKILGFLSLGADFGYRTAFISGFTAAADSTNTAQLNIKKDGEFRDPDGLSVPVDYSGINAGICVKFEF